MVSVLREGHLVLYGEEVNITVIDVKPAQQLGLYTTTTTTVSMDNLVSKVWTALKQSM